jgi:hypothetical protein
MLRLAIYNENPRKKEKPKNQSKSACKLSDNFYIDVVARMTGSRPAQDHETQGIEK